MTFPEDPTTIRPLAAAFRPPATRLRPPARRAAGVQRPRLHRPRPAPAAPRPARALSPRRRTGGARLAAYMTVTSGSVEQMPWANLRPRAAEACVLAAIPGEDMHSFLRLLAQNPLTDFADAAALTRNLLDLRAARVAAVVAALECVTALLFLPFFFFWFLFLSQRRRQQTSNAISDSRHYHSPVLGPFPPLFFSLSPSRCAFLVPRAEATVPSSWPRLLARAPEPASMSVQT